MMGKTVLFVGFFLLVGSKGGWGQQDRCVPKSYGPGKMVCVCNATYCDETPEQNPKVPVDGKFYWYRSSMDGERLSFMEKDFDECVAPVLGGVTLNVDSSIQYQQILGFGGAFTDSAGINIQQLSEAAQDRLLYSYFGEGGSRYSLCRVPIAGSDFSTRPYTYDDVADDITLEKFSLTLEDYKYKIPFIQKALELRSDLLMISTPWSAPTWMKTNDKINGLGFLKEEYYNLYVDYLLKFLDAYQQNGIDIWAMTTGNEPVVAYIPLALMNSMAWTPNTLSHWIANSLGPKLENSKYNGTKIIVLDDQRIFLPTVIKEIFANEKAYNYSSGAAVHIYLDLLSPAHVLTETHNQFPDKFLLMTEGSVGALGPHVDFGAWDRGETYMTSILEYLNHWSIGWLDWNLVLNGTGGPNWIGNFVDSPIITNATADEYYKQPMYYALKHFSRFVERGSTRINITDDLVVKSSAFVTPSNETVVVLFNKSNFAKHVTVNDLEKGKFCVNLPARSMHTIIYGN